MGIRVDFLFNILCYVECLEGCDEDDQPVRAATVAAQYSLLNYGQLFIWHISCLVLIALPVLSSHSSQKLFKSR